MIPTHVMTKNDMGGRPVRRGDGQTSLEKKSKSHTIISSPFPVPHCLSPQMTGARYYYLPASAIAALTSSCAIVPMAVRALSPPHDITRAPPSSSSRATPSSTAAFARRAFAHRPLLGSANDVDRNNRDIDLFWPASLDVAHSADDDDATDGTDDEYIMDDDERLLTSTLDAVVKVYATHNDPDFLIPWQRKHQTSSTSSGFVINVPGIGIRVMTNAHSVEYGSVVQVQRRGDDEKHEAIVVAVGNECDLALLRVDSLFPPPTEGDGVDDATTGSTKTTYALPLGPLPPLQDEVEVLGYPAGGDSLCVTKGVVSRIEMQEYAQAGARLLAMQIDAAINPGTHTRLTNLPVLSMLLVICYFVSYFPRRRRFIVPLIPPPPPLLRRDPCTHAHTLRRISPRTRKLGRASRQRRFGGGRGCVSGPRRGERRERRIRRAVERRAPFPRGR